MKLFKKPIALVPLLILVSTIIGTAAGQLYSRPALTKSSLHSQLSEFQSYDNETFLLIDEYLKDKITFTYMSLQLEQIQKQVLSVTDIYQNNKINNEFESGVKQISNLAIDYATIAQRIERSNGDKHTITEGRNDIKKVDKQVDEQIKKYE